MLKFLRKLTSGFVMEIIKKRFLFFGLILFLLLLISNQIIADNCARQMSLAVSNLFITKPLFHQKACFVFTLDPTGVKSDEIKNIRLNFPRNYPNPFNPTTKIRYSIPSVETHSGASPQNVLLKVYDVLGNEIATLVNEEKSPGVYEVEFNAKELASGIYFYRLRAGSFIESRKMVLTK
ncbi:MAG: hypothetical protein CO127_11825 [Ignavibacteria bacterium CG_4_9_14_3_um_filter_36_18]|nr:T9SS type A sorting domain-containing protein [Ignavibacteria bacterium]PJA98888.1 MAG: hypothetical protein CO127_11825 [Ignavibacteria bacterium CG_4_9_14_3_um_filter_36_18]